MKTFATILTILYTAFYVSFAQTPLDLPLFQMQDLEFEGGFRLPASDFGVSDLNYSQGPIAFNPDNQSIYIVGHTYQQAIAEFEVPNIIASSNIMDLEMASNPLQDFVSVLDRSETGNSQNLDRIGGMQYTDGGLIVNCYEYYDANGDVTHSTLKVADASNLGSSSVKGFYSFQGGAGQTSGWISPLPPAWAAYLDADFITGQSSGIPIISRTSVGPTAYTFKKDDLAPEGMIDTEQYLDFSYPNGIHEDLDNSEGENQIWTHLSQVTYGFIVPGTRTYLTIGKSGGHETGVCYKCTQDDGNLCGGYCTPLVSDNYQYYWLWDVRDLMEVNEGSRPPYSVEPYDHGVFNSRFQNGFNEIGGGSYDPESNRLFLTVQGADRLQGTYSNPPVVAVFQPIAGSVLPVKWLTFTATGNEEMVSLEWQVENSPSHDLYEVYKLINSEWKMIGRTEDQLYFLDRDVFSGANSYKIRQVDLNGEYSFSPIQTVEVENSGSSIVFPNPVTDKLHVSAINDSSIFIFNVTGQLMLKTDTRTIDMNAWSTGIYFVRIGTTYHKVIKE